MRKRVCQGLLIALVLLFGIAINPALTDHSSIQVFADDSDANPRVAEDIRNQGEKQKTDASKKKNKKSEDSDGDFEGLSGIIYSLYDQSITCGDIGSQKMEIKFGDLEKSFSNIMDVKNIKQWSVSGINLYETIFKNGIFAVAKTLGVGLAVIFWMMSVCKEAMEFERFDWKRVLIGLLKVGITVMIICGAFEFGEAILELGQEFITNVLSSITNKVDVPNTAAMMAGIQDKANAGWGNILVEIMTFIILFIGALTYFVTLFGCIAGAFEKVFKIFFNLALLPIPIAMSLADEGFRSNPFKSFINLFAMFVDILIARVGVMVCVLMMGAINSFNPSNYVDLGAAIPAILTMLLVNVLLKAIMGLGKEISERITH